MTWSYDLIADVYATDMGRSMPFDDVAYYARVASEAVGAASSGHVLELGCGTGRITIPLAERGLDVVGIDRSLPMLQRARRDAAARGVGIRLAQMDLRSLALDGRFAIALLPYSLVTYVTDHADLDALLAMLARLADRIVLDAFVPRPVTAFEDFRRDYRREHEGGWLEREKRIALAADGTSTIERRYRIRDADDRVLDEFVTRDRIRPYSPSDLYATAKASGLELVEAAYDYGRTTRAVDAQFATLVFRR